MPDRLRNPLVRQGHRISVARLAGPAGRLRARLVRPDEGTRLDETGHWIAGRTQGLPGLSTPGCWNADCVVRLGSRCY